MKIIISLDGEDCSIVYFLRLKINLQNFFFRKVLILFIKKIENQEKLIMWISLYLLYGIVKLSVNDKNGFFFKIL